MLISEYERCDALEIARLVAIGEISAREAMAAAIAAAEARNPALNALCQQRFEESLELTGRGRFSGTFAGVPFLLKDSGLASVRFPSGLGSRLFSGLRFSYDATLTKRFQSAGFVPFARSTVPELAMAPTTEAAANGGPTRNPWDLDRSSGGSSGGAAAAVAAGIVPIAHANDGGGSIRIPSACCGVFGLKPSRGRTPVGPARGEAWAGLAAEGVISRSVRDTAAALDAIHGYEEGAPYASPSAPESYLELVSRPPAQPLRIGKWTAAWEGCPISPECVAALEHAEQLLVSAGHEVFEAPLAAIDYEAFIDALIDMMTANIAVLVDSWVKDRPISAWRNELEPAIFDGYERGRRLPAPSYVRAVNLFHRVGRRLDASMAGLDLILTPTLSTPPASLGVYSMNTDFVSFRRRVAGYTPFLAIVNASGQPAANLPVYWSSSGLPIGVQLIGRFGREDQILQLAAQIEATAPWTARRPPLPASHPRAMQ
jgi:amidase